MSRTRRLFVLPQDADGCLYNDEYSARLVHCIYHNRKFLRQFEDKKSLSPTLQAVIDIGAKRMKEDQRCLKINPKNTMTMRKQLIHDAESYYKDKPLNGNTKNAYDAYLNRYIELLAKFSPDVLGEIACCANKELIEFLKKNTEGFDHVMLVLASNRQSYKHDERNRRNNCTHTIFYDLHYLVNHLKAVLPVPVSLKKFTMPDVYKEGEFIAGVNYDQILAGVVGGDWIFDKTKLSLLYAIIHHVAVTEPDFEHVSYYFVDDKLYIIDASHQKLAANPEMLPSHTELHMRRYVHGKFEEIRYVKGMGMTDAFYRENIHLMAKLCGNKKLVLDQAIDFADQLDVAKFLKKRKTLPAVIPTKDSTQSKTATVIPVPDSSIRGQATAGIHLEKSKRIPLGFFARDAEESPAEDKSPPVFPASLIPH